MTNNIETKALRYIVPFKYTVPYDEAVALLDNETCEGISYEREWNQDNR